MSMINHADGTTQAVCVVDGCDWRHTQPPINDHVGPSTLAEVFGPNIMLTTAINHRNQQIEDALSTHYRGHTIEDFLKTIVRLQHAAAAPAPDRVGSRLSVYDRGGPDIEVD